MSGDQLNLDEVEKAATLILAEQNREHDWHNPYPGSNLQCRACGLWHGRWSGDGCPGANPDPIPNVDLGLGTMLTLVAEVRRLRAEVTDLRLQLAAEDDDDEPFPARDDA